VHERVKSRRSTGERRERACGRDEQRAEIMQRTIAHVGANELSEQEWIATASRYADALARRTAKVRRRT
jgi:hypothetical protein